MLLKNPVQDIRAEHHLPIPRDLLPHPIVHPGKQDNRAMLLTHHEFLGHQDDAAVGKYALKVRRMVGELQRLDQRNAPKTDGGFSEELFEEWKCVEGRKALVELLNSQLRSEVEANQV